MRSTSSSRLELVDHRVVDSANTDIPFVRRRFTSFCVACLGLALGQGQGQPPRERGSLCGSGCPFSENNCVQNYPLQALASLH